MRAIARCESTAQWFERTQAPIATSEPAGDPSWSPADERVARTTGTQLSSGASHHEVQAEWWLSEHRSMVDPVCRVGQDLDGEFDPGSGRTLAACLKHASRTRSIQWQHW